MFLKQSYFFQSPKTLLINFVYKVTGCVERSDTIQCLAIVIRQSHDDFFFQLLLLLSKDCRHWILSAQDRDTSITVNDISVC